jgi:hypothetical protein
MRRRREVRGIDASEVEARSHLPGGDSHDAAIETIPCEQRGPTLIEQRGEPPPDVTESDQDEIRTSRLVHAIPSSTLPTSSSADARYAG